MNTHLTSVITCTQPSSTTPRTPRYFPPCTCTRRFQSLRDHPSTATCPLSSFSASWVSCRDSPGLADTRATQHQGLEHFATANIPKAAAPGSASPKQGNLLGSQPRAGDNQRSTDHHRDCLQKCQKSQLSFFFPKHPSLFFGLAGSQVRAGSPRGRQPAPKHNGRTWESLPSLFPSLQTWRLGRRKEFRHRVGSYILRAKQPPLFLARR